MLHELLSGSAVYFLNILWWHIKNPGISQKIRKNKVDEHFERKCGKCQNINFPSRIRKYNERHGLRAKFLAPSTILRR